MRSGIRKALFGLLVAIAMGMVAPVARAAEHLLLILPIAPGATEAVFYLAKEMGLYEKAGLDLEIEDGRGSGYVMQVLTAGHGDIGLASLTPMAAARDKGAPLRAIAQFYAKSDMALVVPRDSSIKTGEDIRGKSFVLSTAGPWPQIIPAFLSHLSMNESNLNLVNVDGAAIYSTYSSGKVDGMMTMVNAIVQVDPLRPSRYILATDVGVNLPGLGQFATERTIAEKKPALEKFMKIQKQVFEYIDAGHEEEALSALLKQRPDLSLNRDILRTQMKLAREFIRTPETVGKPVGWQSEANWTKQVKFMEESGIIKPGHTPQEFFTNEFIDAAGK